MIKEVGYLVIVLLGIPVGIILYTLCKEEVNSWVSRIKFVPIICVILGVFVWIVNLKFKVPITISLIFILVTNLILIKNGGKK